VAYDLGSTYSGHQSGSYLHNSSRRTTRRLRAQSRHEFATERLSKNATQWQPNRRRRSLNLFSDRTLSKLRKQTAISIVDSFEE
jgi:hypothetical protein